MTGKRAEKCPHCGLICLASFYPKDFTCLSLGLREEIPGFDVAVTEEEYFRMKKLLEEVGSFLREEK